jgi:hypothetical protein
MRSCGGHGKFEEKLAVFGENNAKWRQYSKNDLKKISTILAEDGGDQTSITQTSRLEIVQSQFEGL